ncbi:MAG: radical SAM protein [Desulfurivibrio sp.]|nr:radical SAM protein [Desulfurivibrio sp.]
MEHIFGPVNSRRLGISLGIDLLPPKICNFNCIYCEVGATTTFTSQRGEYTPTAAIIAEIDAYLADPEASRRVDTLTITASGEPTLHSGLGEIIAHLQKVARQQVAVLTNGSLLHLPAVRRELAAADIVLPSLDAAREESFRRINRPATDCDLKRLIDGLVAFRREFGGHYLLEILLAKGINDQPADLAALAAAVERIQPEAIQLNTVSRPPLEDFAHPLSRAELQAAAAVFKVPVSIPGEPEAVDRRRQQPASQDDVLHLLQRRPCPAADVATALGITPQQATTVLRQLTGAGKVKSVRYNDRDFFQIT